MKRTFKIFSLAILVLLLIGAVGLPPAPTVNAAGSGPDTTGTFRQSNGIIYMKNKNRPASPI